MTNVVVNSPAPRKRRAAKLTGLVALSLLAGGTALGATNITLISLKSLIGAQLGGLSIFSAIPIILKTSTSQPDQAHATPTPTPTPTPAPRYPSLGVNVSSPSYYSGDRIFMNLAVGGAWGSMQTGVTGSQTFDSARLDEYGTVQSLLAGERAIKVLVPPEAAYGASVVRIRCVWLGQGKMNPSGAIANVSYGTNGFDFDWQPANGPKAKSVLLSLTQTDPSDPVRRIDCREKSASETATFSPQFLEMLSGYKLLRFMDWENTNANASMTWAKRTRPEGENQMAVGGVAVEHMVALANAVGADAWFTVPWNADEDYVRRFATYVRDNLAPGRKAYVEVANEVWNWGFRVTSQARDEGMAEGLSTNTTEAMLRRYSEKSAWAMKIWTDVFKASPDRLVRVIGVQHGSTWSMDKVLTFGDTAQYVDAVASAPYFGGDVFSGARAAITDPDNIFAYLDTHLDSKLVKAVEMKKAAAGYGKRYIAYEGGQHLVNADNISLVASINRDPRMYDLYSKYLSEWQEQIGDTMTLFSSHGPVSKFGAWGMREYAGQPLDQTPKRRAAIDFMNTAL